VSEVIRYDEALARRVQALGDTWEIVEQWRRVLELLAPAPGEGILDGGCGPGHLTREIAALIGPAGRACGVDVSEQMLVLATGEDVEFTLSSGAALPYESSCFDAAVATQVYEYGRRGADTEGARWLGQAPGRPASAPHAGRQPRHRRTGGHRTRGPRDPRRHRRGMLSGHRSWR
jgi:SAM-dependent methyltransferase